MDLSEEEIAVLSDTRFLVIKNELSQKVIRYLSVIERSLHRQISTLPFAYPEGTFLKSGKISKGEQYRGLPYFILDYPRLFTQKEVFAFRVMLWWGNHFSCTLHLEGNVLTERKETIIRNIADQPDLHFCVNEQPWDYQFTPDNYLRISDLTEDKMSTHIHQHGFLKISDFMSVTEWPQYESFVISNFARFLGYL